MKVIYLVIVLVLILLAVKILTTRTLPECEKLTCKETVLGSCKDLGREGRECLAPAPFMEGEQVFCCSN